MLQILDLKFYLKLGKIKALHLIIWDGFLVLLKELKKCLVESTFIDFEK